MAPFDIVDLSTPMFGLLFIVLGGAFGFILESSGFGDSRKLAGQFYFTDNTVLKVMFTAIAVAMVLVSLSVGVGWLDFDALWVNPTFIWPVMAGGFVMGLGFIVGGYCPGTSLVGAATLKIDAMIFVGGVFVGVFFFGETVGLFEGFFNSGDMGHTTLADTFGLEPGVVAILVALLAIGMFTGFGMLKRKLHGGEPPTPAQRRRHRIAAGVLLAGAALVWVVGVPTVDEKWEAKSAEHAPTLEERKVQIDPAELLELMDDDFVDLRVVDVRPERDWNLFRLSGAVRVPLDQLEVERKRFEKLPPEAVVVLVSNDEALSTQAWQRLMALTEPNVYILEGGLNQWLDIYGHADPGTHPLGGRPDGRLRWALPGALGARHPASSPDPHHVKARTFVKKVELKANIAKAGGCG